MTARRLPPSSDAPARPDPGHATPGDHLRPCYHVTAPQGWLNDPNGVIKVGETFHLFYQHNPDEAVWSNIHWGHVASTDLVHWQPLPIALAPTPGGPDGDGCWSGCSVIGPDGPVVLYTARDGERETVCLAHGDAALRTWRKDPRNPVLAAPAALPLSDFRDPRVWREADGWRMVIGVGLERGPGAVLLYRSSDLYGWELVGPILEGDESSIGQVWECPDVFSLDGRGVLIYSVTPGPESTQYVTGDWDGRSFRVVGHGLMDQGPYFYAAQTLADQVAEAPGSEGAERRIVWGWLREGRTVEAQRQAGWSGAMSLPRLVSLDEQGRLLMNPVPELEALRGPVTRVRDLRLAAGEDHALTEDAGHAWEGRIRFSADPGARLRLALCASADDTEVTFVECDPMAGTLVLDRRRSSLSADSDLDLCEHRLWESARDEVEVRVFVDGSVMELFIDGLSVTTRIYPTRPDSTGVALSALGGEVRLGSVETWPLASM